MSEQRRKIPAFISSALKTFYGFWVNLSEQIPYERWRLASLHSLPFWVGAIISAGLAVVYSKMFSWFENIAVYLVQSHEWVFLALCPLLLLISALMVKYWARAAGGSGIPQILAALGPERINNTKHLDTLLGVKTFFVKLVSSLIAITGGAVIGREGPTIQLSGSVFYLIHKYLPKGWPRI
ncbi:MAG TPA: chloride channel protein, partial [Chitinophagales bacterium]|nr:chloride channel protein [Chitinophagales bacterium]